MSMDNPKNNDVSRINQLLESLCDLAAEYRHYHSLGEITNRDTAIADYLTAMSKLHALGWEGSLDFECELPYEYMPETYLKDLKFNG